MQEQTYRTPNEVARIVGFSGETVRNWIKRGHVPAREIAGRFWIGPNGVRAAAERRPWQTTIPSLENPEAA